MEIREVELKGGGGEKKYFLLGAPGEGKKKEGVTFSRSRIRKKKKKGGATGE